MQVGRAQPREQPYVMSFRWQGLSGPFDHLPLDGCGVHNDGVRFQVFGDIRQGVHNFFCQSIIDSVQLIGAVECNGGDMVNFGKNDIFVEITSRIGHSLCNGRVVQIGREAGVSFLINTDSHNHNDLYRGDFQKEVALGSGLSPKEYEEIIKVNQDNFLKKIGYR